jgi:hypothetical protein
MSISPNDLSLVLSGGESNKKPEKSLGGYPSAILIETDINNLFSDVEQGTTESDYRCIYVFNDNTTNRAFYNLEIYLETRTEQSAEILVGLPLVNEQQVITFDPIPTSGTFSLKLGDIETSSISWAPSSIFMAVSIQAALNALPFLGEVTVLDNSLSQYVVSFAGESGNRAWPPLELTDSTLTPFTSLLTSRTIKGSPINSIAPLLNTSTDEPPAIEFVLAEKPGILLQVLRAGEGFPLWFQRTPNSNFSSSLLSLSQDGYD